MIKIRLEQLLAERERSLYWLWKESGVRYATLLQMNGGEVGRINMDTLDRICTVLKCQPGDLLVKTQSRKKG